MNCFGNALFSIEKQNLDEPSKYILQEAAFQSLFNLSTVPYIFSGFPFNINHRSSYT